MIIGNYYINNFLILFVALGFIGGGAYFSGAFDSLTGGASSFEEVNFSLSENDLRPGEEETLALTSRQGSVQNAAVYLDGDKIGETGVEGRITFTVPEKESVTLKAVKSGRNFTKSFNLDLESANRSQNPGEDSGTGDSSDSSNEEDGSSQDSNGSSPGSEGPDSNESVDNNVTEPIDENTGDNESEVPLPPSLRDVNFTLLSPMPGGTVTSGKITLQASLLTAGKGSYTMFLNGSETGSGSFEGRTVVSSAAELSEEGLYVWKVTAERNGKTYESGKANFTYRPSVSEGVPGGGQPRDVEPAKIFVFQPEGEFTGYEVEFDFSLNNSELEGENFAVYVDGSKLFEGVLTDQGMNRINERKVIQNSGSHQWHVEMTDGSFESEARSFSTTENAPEFKAELEEPVSGATINDYLVSFNLSTESPYDYRLLLYTDGNLRYNKSHIPSQNIGTIKIGLENAGQHTWHVELKSQESNNRFTSETRSFTTQEDAPLADIFIHGPSDDITVLERDSPLFFNYDVRAFGSMEQRLVINGKERYSSQLSKGLNEIDTSLDLGPGNYTWQIVVEGDKGTVKSSERYLEVRSLN
ncbi:MAG: hypothetical protein ABEJ93_01290 [Candidatus Nanohalobium sp.]